MVLKVYSTNFHIFLKLRLICEVCCIFKKYYAFKHKNKRWGTVRNYNGNGKNHNLNSIVAIKLSTLERTKMDKFYPSGRYAKISLTAKFNRKFTRYLFTIKLIFGLLDKTCFRPI
jgi:hypothetical protein